MTEYIDPNVFELCCQSLKVPSGLPAGAEAPFFGAMCGLIAFRGLTEEARRAWDTTCQAAASRPGQFGFPSRTSVAWMTLYQSRQDAFEFYTDSASIKQQDVGIFPWCLTPQEFADGQAALNAGKEPHTTTVSNVDWMKAFGLWKSLSGPIVGFVKLGVKVLIPAAEIIETANPYVDIAEVLGAPAIGFIAQQALKEGRAQTKKQYRIDGQRRQAMSGTVFASQS